MIRKILAAACSLMMVGGANAEIVGFGLDGNADATGTGYGSTDTFSGVGAPWNGTTLPFYLEALDPGLYWREWTLEIDSVSDTDRSATGVVSIGGYVGTLVSAVDDDPPPNSLIDLQGWTYTYSFTGSIAGDSTTTLTMSGFGSNLLTDVGTATLTATAVPEPETYAMMLAGLGVMGFLSRRRRAAK